MKKDLPGLLMVAAAIVVVGLIVGLLYTHQVKAHRDKVRVHGVALTRALSSAELPQLVSGPGRNSLVSTLVSVQDSDALPMRPWKRDPGDGFSKACPRAVSCPPRPCRRRPIPRRGLASNP